MNLNKDRSDFGFTPYNDQSGVRYGINLNKGKGLRNIPSTKSHLSINKIGKDHSKSFGLINKSFM